MESVATETITAPPRRRGPRPGIRFTPLLAEILSRKHGTAAEVAREVGISYSTLSRLASNQLGCNEAIARQIAAALRTPMRDLILKQ